MFGERLYACVYTPDVFAVAQTYCVFAVKSLNILCLLHFSVRLLLFSFFLLAVRIPLSCFWFLRSAAASSGQAGRCL